MLNNSISPEYSFWLSHWTKQCIWSQRCSLSVSRTSASYPPWHQYTWLQCLTLCPPSLLVAASLGFLSTPFFFFKTYLFLDALGLRCCVQASLHLQEMVASLQWRFTLLPEMASLVAEHRLWGMQTSPVVVLSCSTTHGIFPGQGWRRAWLHRLRGSLLEVNPGWNIRQLCDLETQSPHLHRHISFYYTSFAAIAFYFFF